MGNGYTCGNNNYLLLHELPSFGATCTVVEAEDGGGRAAAKYLLRTRKRYLSLIDPVNESAFISIFHLPLSPVLGP